MAIAASDSLVAALQQKIGECVIERGFVQLDNDHIPAFVLGVTAGTVITLRHRKAAVKADLLVNIVADVFMTYNTQVGLWLIRDRIVATAAVLFDFGMPGDHRSRHDQPLLQCRCMQGSRVSYCCQCEHHDDCEQTMLNAALLHQ